MKHYADLKRKAKKMIGKRGYKEIFSYLDGSVTLEHAISEIKKNTRRYAKRQITWLRSKKNIIWVNEKTSLKNLIDQICLK